MAAGEREWDERPIAAPSEPAEPVMEPSKMGCGLIVLLVVTIPLAFGVLFVGGMVLTALFGG